ncbi:MAG TPA: DUF3570 domain-containing protein [Chitinophagaceae bacterium]|nr:DUF3570 domain-containing protein [Chitinophagaceae bacterium]
MKRICLTVLGIFIWFMAAFSQSAGYDTSSYKPVRLKLDEADLVSGYYSQNGNHSAVTGGTGSEQLHDISNVIDLKFVKWDPTGTNQYHLDMEVGLDHHTAASQAYVSQTGASRAYGTRFYPSLNWSVQNGRGFTFGVGASFSTEYNYHSFGLNAVAGKTSRSQNTDITLRGQVFLDRVGLIYPSELAPSTAGSGSGYSTYTTASGQVIGSYGGDDHYTIPTSPRNTYAGSLTWSQVINRNMQVALLADFVGQNGLLSLPFHRVYFNDNSTEKIENLPDIRLKIPLGMRLNYFLGDKLVLRSYYRYYRDNWGIRSHTASLETPYKLSPFVSVAPFYRYYTQTASCYFAPYAAHKLTDTYYTSNYELSAMNTHYAGINLRFAPQKGLYIFDLIELRYGHYVQTTGLHGDNIAINFRFR